MLAETINGFRCFSLNHSHFLLDSHYANVSTAASVTIKIKSIEKLAKVVNGFFCPTEIGCFRPTQNGRFCPTLTSSIESSKVSVLCNASICRRSNSSSGISTINLTSSLIRIGEKAFSKCTGLTEINIPDSVTSIVNYAFHYCTELTCVTFLNPKCNIGDSNLNVFQKCYAYLVLCGWPSSTAETYAQAAGISFAALVVPAPTFILPADLTLIEAEAFSGIATEAILFPFSVTSIEGDPFSGSSVQCISGMLGSAAEILAEDYSYIFVPVTN